MTESVRWDLACYCLSRADSYMQSRRNKKRMKGLEYLDAAVEIVPPSGLDVTMSIIDDMEERSEKIRHKKRA